MLSIMKEFLFFGWLFILVILGLYMDMWISVPKEAFRQIFLHNFPWNLLLFTGVIYIGISILQFIYRKLFRL